MSTVGNGGDGRSGKKRKHDHDEVSTPQRVKKQRHSMPRQSSEVGSEAVSESREQDESNRRKTKKEKRTQKRHARRANREDGQTDADQDQPSPRPQDAIAKPIISNPDRESKKLSTVKESATDTKKKSKRALKRSKMTQENPNLSSAKKAEIQSRAEHSSSESSRPVARKSKKKHVLESRGSLTSKSGWTMSYPLGGRFLNIDPIFVQDADGQDYVITGNHREMQLLSLETSLVVRTLSARNGRSVQSFTINSPDEDLVRVAYDDGSVRSWNWMSEVETEAKQDFTAPGPVIAMAATRPPKSDRSTVVYITKGFPDYMIYCRDPALVLFKTRQQLETIQVFGEMEYILAHGQSTVVLGSRKEGEHIASEFIWTQIPLMSKATCVHARLLPVEPATKKSKPQRPGLSLAVGNADGQIHLYDDISSVSGRDGRPQLPPPRILHWHREAVSSVKFSQDGNYLISGGKETVLVLWQLQTAKKQFLPHLTSAIERIVVNPKGDRYAVQMGDNSIMVLSTSELKPVANFAGIQMSTLSNTAGGVTSRCSAAILHPHVPDQLLLSVPSTQPKSQNDISSRPFLQAFDLRTSRHIARQALTRNNVTDFNLGPEGTHIVPPDVEQIAISRDGSWLATVDEWTPPASDLEHLVSSLSDLETLRKSRREIYLKFWKWDSKEDLWTLTTRVDAPHSLPDGNSVGSGKLLALISDPSTNSFATIGEDSCVKIWRPKKRTRHGVTLKDGTDTDLMEWSCKCSIQLPRKQGRVDSPFASNLSTNSTTACLSYASDGSMLAAAVSTDNTEESPVVYFINPATGSAIPKTGLASSEIAAIGFVDQYFVAVSRPAAYIWDLINDTLMYKIKISSRKQTRFESWAEPILAVDSAGGTFALGTKVGKEDETKISVYSPKETEPLYKKTFNVPVEAVLARTGASGYTLLFGDASIRHLSSAGAISGRFFRAIEPRLTKDQADQQTAIDAAVAEPEEDMSGIVKSAMSGERGAAPRAPEDDEEDDPPVVRPEQLANIFDTAQSFAMPPVRDMFEAVVGLFGRRPYVKPPVEVS